MSTDISRGVLKGDIFSPVAFIVGLWRTFATHDISDGVTVGSHPYEVSVSGLEYADDAALLDVDAQLSSVCVIALSRGSKEDAAMEISIPKTKAMHIHKKVPVTATEEAEISALHLKHKCPDPNCGRDFPTSRGLKIHISRWCDGGKTIRFRKGSLADKSIQRVKRITKEKQLDNVMLDGHQIENVYSFEYLGSHFQCDGDEKAEMKYRMEIAQAIFSSL